MNRKILAISFVALASAMSSGYGMTAEEQTEENPYNHFFHNNKTEEENLEHSKAVNYHIGRYHRSLTDGPPLLESLLKTIRQNTVNPAFKQGIFDSWRNDDEGSKTRFWIISSALQRTELLSFENANEIITWLNKKEIFSKEEKEKEQYCNVIKLSCGHMFHKICPTLKALGQGILKWIEQSLDPNCPLCRAQITKPKFLNETEIAKEVTFNSTCIICQESLLTE